MIFYRGGNGYSGASYRLEHSDGTTEYFNSEGRIIAIVDRFDNAITFSYEFSSSDSDVVSAINIVDTLGNIIKYADTKEEFDPDALPSLTGKATGEYNSVWTLSLNNEVVKTYYIRKSDPDDTSVEHLLLAVEDSLGNYTFYSTSEVSYAFNSFVPGEHSNDGSRKLSRMNKVTYPNGLIKQFSISKKTERLGSAGYTEYPSTSFYLEYYEDSSQWSGHHKYLFGRLLYSSDHDL